MYRFFLTAAITALCFVFTVNAQTPDKPDGTATTKKPVNAAAVKEYEELVKKVKSGDLKVDFARLRMVYTDTPDYSPYGGSEERNAMAKAYRAGEYKKAVDAAQEMLKKNFPDLLAHQILALSYDKLDKAKEAEFHSAVLDAMLEAILKNDGLTAKTGIVAIGISEQYFIMSWLGYERQSKALVQDNGSVFDVHTAYNEKTKDTRKFYFNIDKVFGRLF